MATACSHPIRLRGWQERIDGESGELLSQIVTAREPGGVLLVACGDRRAASCPSCAELYRHVAFQLVATGLRGGKGVPEAVATHPAVMLTLTAPSFGPVHTIRDRDGFVPAVGGTRRTTTRSAPRSIPRPIATSSRRSGTILRRRSGSGPSRRSDGTSRSSSASPATGWEAPPASAS